MKAKWSSGTSAAYQYLIFILAISVLANVLGLAGAGRDLINNNKQEAKTSYKYCESKLRATGYELTAQNAGSEGSSEQKTRLDVCLQVRSVEAAEDSAKYARRQYWFTVGATVLAAIAAFAAAAAACFTWQQAVTASDALAADNRPWVSLTSATVKFEIGKTPEFTVSCINSGRSPGVNFRNNAKMWLTDKLGQPEALDKMDDAIRTSTNSVSPNLSIEIPLSDGDGTIKIDEATMNAINAGDVVVWLLVRLEYESFVGASVPYFSTYKLRYRPLKGSFAIPYSHVS